jgi:putative OPT family oligopeptide transporter
MADSTGIQTSHEAGGGAVTKLPTAAAPPGDGASAYKPYIAANVTGMPEFTLQAVLVGAILGIIFGASSLYLVLRVGMTVSASIPVAVLSITLFRGVSKMLGTRATTILENNIVQTTGSAGESIAFGVGVTMPALLLIGYEMDLARIMVVSVLGGILGILMMIPLRRAFIVQLHGRPGEPGKLLYPEGTACAQVLISGEKGGTSGQTVFIGFGIAFVHKFLTEGMHVLRTTLEWSLGRFYSKAAVVAGDAASELLGVGYIIGFRISAIMMAGAVLGTLVLGPTMFLYGGPGGLEIDEIHKNIKFIGAGCVAAAGIISMCRTLPMIVRSLAGGLGSLRGGAGPVAHRERRTENDMSMRFVFIGSLVLLGLLTIFLQGEFGWLGGLLGSLLVLIFGFLFVTVSSRLTGEIGSSSNPISGMTVATLLLTCLIFLALGMRSTQDAVLALSIGGVVCIAASNGGTTSQDLKTGFLIGGTPRWQQWAIIIGALTSAIVIGAFLLGFSKVGIVYSQRNLPNIDLASQVSSLTEKEELPPKVPTPADGVREFHVWRPKSGEHTFFSQADALGSLGIGLAALPEGSLNALPIMLVKQTGEVKPGKYLVDDKGRVRYYVDPTITGDLKQRDEYTPLAADADAKVRETNLKDDLGKMKTTVTLANKEGALTAYHLWNNEKPKEKEEEGEEEGKAKKAEPPPYKEDVPEGEYLIDQAGGVAYTVKGEKVNVKFEAPKTQVMGIIINGLLRQQLNWTMVLIGAFIAVTLELCGVSSLAFAVGVYVPMQYSVPIFCGGLVRWAVDAYALRRSAAAVAGGTPEERAAAEVRAIARTESSPAVLLASGFIAGGSLAGVLLAFLEIDQIPGASLTKWLVDQSERIKGTFLDVNRVAIPLALVCFGALIALLVLTGMGKLFPQADEPEPSGDVSPERME